MISKSKSKCILLNEIVLLQSVGRFTESKVFVKGTQYIFEFVGQLEQDVIN